MRQEVWRGRPPAEFCHGREPRRHATARWLGELPTTAKAVPRRPQADEAARRTLRRRAGPHADGTTMRGDAGAPGWSDRWSPVGLSCPRRAAWGEFDGLLATRVGEASIPGPAADAGQRTLRLAPGGGLTLAAGPGGAPGPGGLPPPAGGSPRTPARAGTQRTLDFGSASSVPVPRTEDPADGADDDEQTPGDVRSLLSEFERLDVDGSQPQGQEGARQPKRIRAVGGQACSACAQDITRGRWGYGCSGCAVAYCCAACRGRGFGAHACDATGAANVALAAAVEPDPGPPGRAVADIVIPSTGGFRDMLEAAVSRPALQTMEWIPRKHRVRTAEVLRDLYGAHVEAERAALRGGAAHAADAVAAERLLWLGPTLLLRSRSTYDDDVLAPPVAEVATKGVERANMVRALAAGRVGPVGGHAPRLPRGRRGCRPG